MNIHLLSLLCAGGLCACTAVRVPAVQSPRTCENDLEVDDVFSREDVEGVFVLWDEATSCMKTTDSKMDGQGFSPKSTFKIVSALIGLETGIIKGEEHLWHWDGAPRALRDWERDLDLGGALRASCVPCFQAVVHSVGEERMSSFLRDFGYGNQDISGPIDQFWLDGPLEISPRQQVDFVRRLLSGELEVEMSNVELVWRLLEMEIGPDYTFRGKTGLGAQDGRAIGWLVGYVEYSGNRWIYATLVRGRADTDVHAEMARIIPLRKSITLTLLKRSQVLAEQ